jgi:undecaprenyl-diphosphatase
VSTPEAMLAFITTRDHRLMRRVNRWSAPKWIRLWMTGATRGGDGWIWYALAFTVWLLGGEQGPRAVAACTLAAAMGVAVFIVLKRATGRRRPCQIDRHCWSTLLPPDQFSFPSGHTITAFAIAIGLGCFYPGMNAGLGFIALSIAASRILLGMHFLSDVVAGALIGSVLGYASYAALRFT